MHSFEEIFLKMINMSITASYIIIVILLIRICIRKAPKIFSYFLWAAVGFRLICSVSFSSILSIFNFRMFDLRNAVNEKGTVNYISSQIGNMKHPQIYTGITAADHVINRRLPAAVPYASINPMQVMVAAATVIWITGIVGMLMYSIVSYVRLMRRISKAVLLRDNIYECDSINSPFVIGIWHPRIMIPFRLSETEQEYILRHEAYHIKRLDYLVKPFAFLLLTVYWFNPLVWLSFYCMNRDMEMSCDEKVLGDMGDSIKREYSRSLLNLAIGRHFPKAGPLAFGESAVKERVKNILQFKKQKLWILAGAALICILVTVACCSNASVFQSYLKYKGQRMNAGSGSTTNYQYSFSSDIHSVAVYEEIYKNGVLYDTQVKMYGNINADELKNNDTVTVSTEPVSDKNGNFRSLNWNVSYQNQTGAVTTIPTELPEGAYRGFSLVTLGENSRKKIMVKPGNDKIIFAAYFSNNEIQALSCEDLMAGPGYYTYIMKNMSKVNACVIVHAVFSNQKADILKKQLTSSYAMKLYQSRNRYIGDAPANGRILGLLGISYSMGDFTTMLKTDKEPYILRMRFSHQPDNKEEFNRAMENYADILLALIQNSGEIQWSYPESVNGKLTEKIYRCTAQDASKSLDIDNIKDYGKSVTKVQKLLELIKNKV